MIFSNERDDRPARFRDEVLRGKNFSSFEKSWSKNEIGKYVEKTSQMDTSGRMEGSIGRRYVTKFLLSDKVYYSTN